VCATTEHAADGSLGDADHDEILYERHHRRPTRLL